MIYVASNGIYCNMCNMHINYPLTEVRLTDACHHIRKLVEECSDILKPVTIPEMEHFVKSDNNVINDIIGTISSMSYLTDQEILVRHIIIKATKNPRILDKLAEIYEVSDSSYEKKQYFHYIESLKTAILRSISALYSLKDLKHIPSVFHFVSKIKTKIYHPLKNNVLFGNLAIYIEMHDMPLINMFNNKKIEYEFISIKHDYNIFYGMSSITPIVLEAKAKKYDIFFHPHASKVGELCLGENGGKILLRLNNLFMIISNILTIIQQYNPPDAYRMLEIKSIDIN